MNVKDVEVMDAYAVKAQNLVPNANQIIFYIMVIAFSNVGMDFSIRLLTRKNVLFVLNYVQNVIR